MFYNFATDYEQDERIGAGLEIAMAEAWFGRSRLTAEVFFLDTSLLSNSIFSRPAIGDPTADRAKRLSRDDGGPSNTGRLDSATVALAGREVPWAPGLDYHLSLTRQAVALAGEKAENGASASLGYTVALSPHVDLAPYLEYALVQHAGGDPDLRRDYLVGGATLSFGDFDLAAAGGGRRNHTSGGGATAWDHQYNVTLGYALFESVHLGIGVNRIRIDGVDSTTLGFNGTYGFSF